MIRRPPRSTLDRSSAASDVYKRQVQKVDECMKNIGFKMGPFELMDLIGIDINFAVTPVSYTHLRAHETVLDIVCRLLLEKKK